MVCGVTGSVERAPIRCRTRQDPLPIVAAGGVALSDGTLIGRVRVPGPCRAVPAAPRGAPRGSDVMLNRFARALFTRLLTPVARALLAVGVSPDVVTLVGTLGVCFGALAFYPRHEFFWGTIVIVAFVFSDTLDGIMARASGRSGAWGAFLDSTLDRIADASVFGGLVLYYGGAADPGAGSGHNRLMTALALACLVFGQIVSYARARAEGLGMTANVGIAERAERLVAVLAATGLVGLGVPEVLLTVVLALLAVASFITVIQRMLTVRHQVLAARSLHPAETGPPGETGTPTHG